MLCFWADVQIACVSFWSCFVTEENCRHSSSISTLIFMMRWDVCLFSYILSLLLRIFVKLVFHIWRTVAPKRIEINMTISIFFYIYARHDLVVYCIAIASEICNVLYLKLLFSFKVVSILESRARSVDLATHNYYDLLYSFHIYRGNYRKGTSFTWSCASFILLPVHK